MAGSKITPQMVLQLNDDLVSGKVEVPNPLAMDEEKLRRF